MRCVGYVIGYTRQSVELLAYRLFSAKGKLFMPTKRLRILSIYIDGICGHDM